MATADPSLPHNRDNIRAWFTTHPGFWRPKQVADHLGIQDHRERVRLYNELARLGRTGALDRMSALPPAGRVRPIVLYGAPSGGQGGRRKTDV